MRLKDLNVELENVPSLDTGFMPLKAYKDAYDAHVENSGKKPFAIAVERNGGQIAVHTMAIHEDEAFIEMDIEYVERMVKFLLWMKGGYKIYICGSDKVARSIEDAYKEDGSRDFDSNFMERVFEHRFEVISLPYESCPKAYEVGIQTGGDLGGCRIGFDAGGSDMKVCAVKDGEVLYTEEIVWLPKLKTNPDYHYEHITAAIDKAASYLPQVDSIGISSAGVYVDNRCMVASLFILIEGDLFEERIKDIYLNITKGYPNADIKVLNDGDVAAVAGAMGLDDNNVMGIAMGTSEAVGFIDQDGLIKGWLNELAFAPVDFNREAMVDEWSGDYGCGCKYFSQDSVIKLAGRAGIEFPEGLSLAEKLKEVQKLMNSQDQKAEEIFENIGIYLGHTLAFYYEMYEMSYLLLLGRVMSGIGGDIIIEKAKEVLTQEYSDIAKALAVSIPDEKSRRIGQSVAAASIPSVQ